MPAGVVLCIADGDQMVLYAVAQDSEGDHAGRWPNNSTISRCAWPRPLANHLETNTAGNNPGRLIVKSLIILGFQLFNGVTLSFQANSSCPCCNQPPMQLCVVPPSPWFQLATRPLATPPNSWLHCSQRLALVWPTRALPSAPSMPAPMPRGA
jgi:hypothetical protein